MNSILTPINLESNRTREIWLYVATVPPRPPHFIATCLACGEYLDMSSTIIATKRNNYRTRMCGYACGSACAEAWIRQTSIRLGLHDYSVQIVSLEMNSVQMEALMSQPLQTYRYIESDS